MVCDHSLVFGYADQKRRIDRPIVNQAIEYLEEGASPSPQPKAVTLNGSRVRLLSRWSFGTLAVALAGAMVGLAIRFDTSVLDLVQSVRHLLLR